MAYNTRKNLRTLSTKNKYWLSNAAFYQAYYFALRYQEFKDTLEEMGDGSRGLSYDSQPHGSANKSSLEDLAIRRARISAKVDIIESACRLADAELYPWLIKAVTNNNVGYDYLYYQLEIPCSRGTFYERRRKFYYILSHKLDELNS